MESWPSRAPLSSEWIALSHASSILNIAARDGGDALDS
jgi:hypothetical protein